MKIIINRNSPSGFMSPCAGWRQRRIDSHCLLCLRFHLVYACAGNRRFRRQANYSEKLGPSKIIATKCWMGTATSITRCLRLLHCNAIVKQLQLRKGTTFSIRETVRDIADKSAGSALSLTKFSEYMKLRLLMQRRLIYPKQRDTGSTAPKSEEFPRSIATTP